jgi:hypothetical protein
MIPQERLFIIAKAIELRDTADSMTREVLYETIESIGKYQLFSFRQIANITCNLVSHSTVARLVDKPRKTGGKLNPKHLEDMRDLIFQNSVGRVDWNVIRKVVSQGTSVDMVVKLTGLPKTTIHRKVADERLLQNG